MEFFQLLQHMKPESILVLQQIADTHGIGIYQLQTCADLTEEELSTIEHILKEELSNADTKQEL